MMPVLRNLILQSKRSSDFHPKAHLCIQTDSTISNGDMSLSIVDLAHTCLRNYFLPHSDAASVSWIDRKLTKHHMMASVIENHSGCVTDYISNILKTSRRFDNADAILFLSRDARAFMATHKKSYRETLAKCLGTTKNRILIMDMSLKPSCFV